MPAPPLANTFESGQADGTTITTGNSGGAAGDAFQVIAGTPKFSTSQAMRGTLSMQVDTTATYTAANGQWTGLGSLTGSVWVRQYCWFPSFPGVTLRQTGVRTNAGVSAFLGILTTGVIDPLNAAQAGNICRGTVAVALNQWVRIEFRVVSSTTVGEFQWWLYNAPDAPVGSFDDTAATTTGVFGANTDALRFGADTVSGPNSYVYYTDDIAVSTVGQIGPSLLGPADILGPAIMRPSFGPF
jgi:hypothetical protein